MKINDFVKTISKEKHWLKTDIRVPTWLLVDWRALSHSFFSSLYKCILLWLFFLKKPAPNACYEGPLTAVSMEGRTLWAQWGGQTFSPHLPNPVSINHSQYTIRTLRPDWFYSRPIEAAETTMYVGGSGTMQLGPYTTGLGVLTKLSLFDFCDWAGTGSF